MRDRAHTRVHTRDERLNVASSPGSRQMKSEYIAATLASGCTKRDKILNLKPREREISSDKILNLGP